MKSMLRLLTSTAIFVGLVGSAYAQTGTAQTATQLNTEIGSTLATGSQITALQLRQVLVDVVASSGLLLGNPTAFTNGISAAGGAFTVDASANAHANRFDATGSTGNAFASTGFSVTASGALTVASCTGCSSASGTVNSGTGGRLAWYATTGTAVSGNAGATLDSSGNVTVSPASGNAQININPVASNQASLLLQSAGVSKWQLGKQTNDTFFLFDVGGNRNSMTVAANGVPTFSFGLAGTGFSVDATGNLTVASCTGCGVGGSGTVNSGTAQQLAWYAGTGTAVSGNVNATVDSSGNITSANQEALLGTFSANNGANSLGMTNVINGTYTYYKIYLDNFVPATEDNFRLQLTTDNGNSYVTTSYVATIVVNQNSGTSVVGTATNGILLSGSSTGAAGFDVGPTSGYGLSGVIYLFDPLSTSKAKYIHGETTWSAGTSAPGTANLTNGRVYGYHNDTNTGYNGFRIATGGGANIVTGTMRVYGIK